MLSRRPSPLRTPSRCGQAHPKTHPNTTLLGFRVCPQTPGEAAEKHLDTGKAPGRKGPFGQPGEAPGRHQRAGKDHLDSLRGTREAPGRQERTILDSLGGTREAPGRQERTIWTAWEAPGRYQGGRKGLIGQPAEAPGRHQGLLKAILCYEDALNGPGAKFKEENRFWKTIFAFKWSRIQKWGLGLYNIISVYSWLGSACSGGSSLGLDKHAPQPSSARRPPRCRSGTPAT